MSVLPGEPTDGTGRACVHLFVQDESGSFVEPHAIHPVYRNGVQVKQEVECRPTRGRLACDPRRDPAPVTRGNATTVTHRTDDPRSVNCPKCLASTDYERMIAAIAATERK
jgi:hypothetical protein